MILDVEELYQHLTADLNRLGYNLDVEAVSDIADSVTRYWVGKTAGESNKIQERLQGVFKR